MSSRFHSLLIANEWSDPGEVNRAQSEHCVVRGQKSPVHCDEFFFFFYASGAHKANISARRIREFCLILQIQLYSSHTDGQTQAGR